MIKNHEHQTLYLFKYLKNLIYIHGQYNQRREKMGTGRPDIAAKIFGNERIPVSSQEKHLFFTRIIF